MNDETNKVMAECPHCGQPITFEFKHDFTHTTTSVVKTKLISILKGGLNYGRSDSSPRKGFIQKAKELITH